VVAQVDKQHAAMIALAMDPAREAHVFADMLAREAPQVWER
jgi:flagellar motility protein MotE (MotC chaperone)